MAETETETKKEEFPFYSLICYIYYILAVVLCEYKQCRYGQPITTAFKDIIMAAICFLFLSWYEHGALWTTTIIFYEIIDMVSYWFTGDSFNLQLFQTVCVPDIVTERITFKFQGFFIIFLCPLMALHPLHFQRWPLKIPKQAMAVLASICIFMLYGFYRREYSAWNPIRTSTRFDTGVIASSNRRINDYFTKPLTVNAKTKKNVILIDLASFELQLIGRYSTRIQFGTPFLSHLSTHSTFARRTILDPALTPQTDSVLYTAVCSMPVNKNPAHILKLFANNQSSAKLHCLGDYLDQLGYNVATYQAGKRDYGGFEKILEKHGVRNVHPFPHDKEMFDSLIQTGLAELVEKQPFALYISNIDTQAPTTAVCKPRDLYKGQPVFAPIDCLDQYLEAFFKALKDHKLTPENTQIAMFGDRPRADFTKTKWVVDPRYLWSMYPYAPKQYCSKESSLFDILPSILDFAGLDYQPRPPFGGNVLNSPNQPPSNRDYDDVYRRFAA
jgi:hypothetical protein